MTRIAIGGFQHETNTFAPVPADFKAFETPGGWPGLSRGETLFTAIDGVNIPIRGAVETLRQAGAAMVPLAWCQATPSAHVTEDAFERISAMLLDDLAEALQAGLDGLYLDLHGAMVCRHLEDGEGELLRRIRDLTGPALPIAVSLDLHANFTEAMVARADYIDIYRTYPHVDMAETGARAARQLLRLTEGAGRPSKAFRRPNFLIPLTFGCTDIDPAQSLYGTTLPDLLRGGRLAGLSLAMGFPLADIREVGPSLIAYGDDDDAANRAADRLLDALSAAEPAFAGRIWQPEAAVAEARRLLAAPGGSGPLVLADTQDNPGGGGTGDTTGLLRALLAAGAGRWPGGAAIGVFNDPETAEAAHRHPVGSLAEFALGGRLCPGDTPLIGRFEIRALGDGRFTGTGPMWGGARFEMGAYACLRLDGIDVVVASRPEQAGDRSMFRHVGLEPERYGVIGLKSSVHFRADFAPIARDILTVAAPGPVFADPAALRYVNVRPGLRIRPGAARPAHPAE